MNGGWVARFRDRHGGGRARVQQAKAFLEAPWLKDSDVFLVSYPRSGNTWVRCIVAHLLYDPARIASLKDLNTLVPDVYVGVDPAVDYSSPRVIKTHQPYSARHERNRKGLYNRNVYILRHPYDVVRSYYDFQLNLWKGTAEHEASWELFVKKFVYGTLGNGSWGEHVMSWKGAESDVSVLFVRYEDLQSDFTQFAGQIACYLGLDPSEAALCGAQERSSQAAMRRLEQAGSLVRADYAFVREQRATRTRVDLTPEQKEMIWRRNAWAMDMFGYGKEHS